MRARTKTAGGTTIENHLKIAVDGTALYGNFGGIEGALWNTLLALEKVANAAKIQVFVPLDAPRFLETKSRSSPLELVRLPFRGAQKKRRILWQQMQLPLRLRAEKFDALHAPTYVAPRLCPVPFLLGAPDLIALNHPQFATRANRLHYRAMMPQSLRGAAAIQVSTRQTAREIERRFPGARIEIAPPGVEPLFFEPVLRSQTEEIRQKYALPREFLLFVGNFEPKKNLPNLLRALEILGEEAPPLILAGGIKPWPQTRKRLASVRQIGFVPRADLPILMRASRVFLFPSRCEGFGLPVLEALATGANIVASSAVPLPKLASVARVPNPRFPRAIALEIRAALHENHDENAAQSFARGFSYDQTARKVWALYEEIGRGK